MFSALKSEWQSTFTERGQKRSRPNHHTSASISNSAPAPAPKRGRRGRPKKQEYFEDGDDPEDEDWNPMATQNFMKQEIRYEDDYYDDAADDDFVIDDEDGDYKPKKQGRGRPKGSLSENKFGLSVFKAGHYRDEQQILDLVISGNQLMSQANALLEGVKWHKTGAYFEKSNYASIKKLLEPYPFRALLGKLIKQSFSRLVNYEKIQF